MTHHFVEIKPNTYICMPTRALVNLHIRQPIINVTYVLIEAEFFTFKILKIKKTVKHLFWNSFITTLP